MALARKFSSYDRSIEGSAARQLVEFKPEPRRAPQSAPRKRPRSIGATLFFLGIWACAMALAVTLVRSGSQVVAETRSITGVREDLAKVQQENKELETRLINSVSVAEVERWAQAHGMQRPTTISAVAGDPTAVAAKVEATPTQVTKEPSGGFFGTIKDYLGQIGSVLGLAKQ